MIAMFEESYSDEFYGFNADRAQAWLRGAGVKEALVYRHDDHSRNGNYNTIAVEAPIGTSNELMKKAVTMGCVSH